MVYHKIKQIAETELGEPIDEEMVARAIYIFKTATAVGIDLWSPADLRRLPCKALRDLANILQKIE
eukprot:10919610-Karenia_brevis.AAC.1